MRGVGDQPSLRRLGALERGHHLVEAAGQTAELVVATHLDPVGEVVSPRHLLGRVRDLAGRRERRARDDRPERRGERDPARADRGQDEDQRVEGVIGVLERAGDLDCGASRQRLRQDPQVGVARLGVLQPRLSAVRGQAAILARDRDRDGRAGPGDDDAVGGDQLGQGLRAARLGRRQRQRVLVASLRARRAAARGRRDGDPGSRGRRTRREALGDALGLLAKVVVDVAPQPVADQRVDQHRGQQHRQGDRQRREQRQPPAGRLTGPVSRSEYPTPRTVWIKRGSPPSSVLRRR